MSIKAKVMAALDKIGNHNGHAAPTSQDPLVPLLHEYYVCTDAESYFKKRREVAKKKLEKELTPAHTKALDKVIKGVKDNGVGDTALILETDPYFLNVECKNGATYVDLPALKVKLLTEHKMNATVVEALIEGVTLRRDPSQSWRVVER